MYQSYSELSMIPQNYPQLSHIEMMKKLKLYHQTNDQSIKEELVLSNMKLVLSLVSRYQQKSEYKEDLFQVGMIGLIKAIDHFDINQNVHFSTYGVPLILGEIKRYIRDSSTLRVPRSLKDIAYKALKENENYINQYHQTPSIKELSKRLDINESLLIEALHSTHGVISLSQDIQNDNSGQVELVQQIPHPHDDIKTMINHLDLQVAYNKLTPKQQQIIKQRYYDDKTQSEIASELIISQAQVSRIEKQALKELKELMNQNRI